MIKRLDIFPAFDSLGRSTFTVKAASKDVSYSVTMPSRIFSGPNFPSNKNSSAAMKVFRDIKENFIGLDEADWENIDTVIEQLGGTPGFPKTGANLAFAISLACAGTANFLGPRNLKGPKGFVPVPMFSVAGGGCYGGEAEWREFFFIPHGIQNAADAASACMEACAAAGEEFSAHGVLIGKNVRNAWAVRLGGGAALDILSRVADDWKLGIGVDFGAQYLFSGRQYQDKFRGQDAWIEFVEELAARYKLMYIEDPVKNSGFPEMARLSAGLKGRCIVAGSDIFGGDPGKVEIAVETRACDCVSLTPPESGTLSRMFRAARTAEKAGMKITASCSHAETGDAWLADLAVAMGAHFMKVGPAGSEMLTKVNRLIELEKEMPNVKMVKLQPAPAGRGFFNNTTPNVN